MYKLNANSLSKQEGVPKATAAARSLRFPHDCVKFLGLVAGNQRWKGMTWRMMPHLAGALAACTYHFFYNSPDMDFMVVIQAALTVIGNATLWWAAYRIFVDAQAESASNTESG